MWAILFGALFLLGIVGLIFLICRIRKFGFLKKISEKNKFAGWGASVLSVIGLAVIFWKVLGYMNAIIILLHLTVFWLFAELIMLVVRNIRKKPVQRYYAGGIAVVFTIIYLGIGWLQAYHVWQADYTVKTDKKVGSLRVAMFADSHTGTTFDGEGLGTHLKEIEKQNPDVLVIVGDFVDEDTSKTDMVNACRALKDVHTTYGVYFVFGNHDKGRYGTTRGYTGDDLVAELEKNGVTVLQDENVLIDDRVYLVGRQDASEELDFGGSRMSVSELTKDLDPDKFSIVLDHQPREYDQDAAAGVDLVLSGHTHGGQLIPWVQLNEWFHLGGDDRTYGTEQRENTNYVVTSGISDWAIKFKTGCRSEYVLIDIEGK